MQTPNQKPLSDFANPDDFEIGQEVDLVIKSQTDLGYKAIINGTHWGVLYENEVFQDLHKDQEIKGFIKKIRDDGRIDISLYKTGHKGAEGVDLKILELLENSEDGFLPITDKALPEYIYNTFGVSKKKFKIALGGLYKARKIEITDDGIKLIRKTKITWW